MRPSARAAIGTALTATSTRSPSGSLRSPRKPPDIVSACAVDRVAPTRMRLAPANKPLVGSYSTF